MAVSRDSLKTTARLAGFLFIWLIISGLTGAMITANISGSGTLAQRSVRVIQSKYLYGLGLVIDLIETMSAMLLAYVLYIILRRFNDFIAQLAMYFRLGESIIGAVGVVFGFVKLYIYTKEMNDTINANGMQPLFSTIQHAGFACYNISAMFFSVGSLLFFFIFYTSRCIPRLLSVTGIVASPIATFLCVASLLNPDSTKWLQLCWAPMAVAEVGTGIWLIFHGIKYNNEPGT